MEHVIYRKHRRFPLLALVAAVLIVPFLIRNNYYLLVLNIAGLNVLVVVGLNLLIGYAGQISLGHAAFFGLGAYCSGILTTVYGLPPWPALLLAAVATGVVAYLIGRPILKLEGHYLVMATLGLGVIFSILINQMDELTGGPSGLAGIKRLALGGRVLDTDRENFFLIWGFVLIALWLAFNLINSRFGRALAALSSNEIAAGCMGVDTERHKVTIFVVSAVLASLAGSLYAHYLTFISPRTFSFFYSIQVVTMVFVGGCGHLWGACFGAILLTLLPESLHQLKDYNVFTYGLILMTVLVFFPEGLLPGVQNRISGWLFSYEGTRGGKS
ncbi:MAG: branched-chain amino acid ABC transporter permease [Deltaproteobacteria bacterium]|nr:branched-chain amino acid ABC transporter permease [Deltaproteobacteria bacterium]MBW2308415.1 branched-chain amino acid ABC transporter permease [Deltaproteobacteria bacterium]